MSDAQGNQEQGNAGTDAAANAGTNAGENQNQNQGQNSQQQQNGQVGGQANGAEKKSLAAGGNDGQQQQQEKPYWPEDWKQKVAEHIGAGNKKAVDKELRRLENLNDPTAIYSNFRSMENTWASRKFVKLPGDDAKPEEVAEYHKALGVPEKPEEYLKDLKLENGAVLGDADKPVVAEFTAAMHKAGTPPTSVHAALNWYFKNMEDQAAALDDADDKHRRESERALKNEYGNAFQRKSNSISALFKTAPGGTDANNPQSLFARIMGGRTADGKIIGNDPDFVRWLISTNQEVNPAASIVEDGPGSGQSVDSEIANIEKTMREDRHRYNKDVGMQNRYSALLAARDKIQARKTA